MTLEEFDQLLMTEIEKFKKYWKENEDWPEEMEGEEWIEQFLAWLNEDV